VKSLTGAKITGIIYEDQVGEKKLLSGLNVEVRLLNDSKVVGVLYRDAGVDENVLSDIQLDGLTFRTTQQEDEQILEASKIVAILYGDPAALTEQRLCDLRIKGLIYQEEGARETKLLSGFCSTVHILPWPRVTSMIFRVEDSPDKKMFNSEGISGFLYQDRNHADVKLVSGVRICGVLCERGRENSYSGADASAQ
jgi:hypothetical protein